MTTYEKNLGRINSRDGVLAKLSLCVDCSERVYQAMTIVNKFE